MYAMPCYPAWHGSRTARQRARVHATYCCCTHRRPILLQCVGGCRQRHLACADDKRNRTLAAGAITPRHRASCFIVTQSAALAWRGNKKRTGHGDGRAVSSRAACMDEQPTRPLAGSTDSRIHRRRRVSIPNVASKGRHRFACGLQETARTLVDATHGRWEIDAATRRHCATELSMVARSC